MTDDEILSPKSRARRRHRTPRKPSGDLTNSPRPDNDGKHFFLVILKFWIFFLCFSFVRWWCWFVGTHCWIDAERTSKTRNIAIGSICWTIQEIHDYEVCFWILFLKFFFKKKSFCFFCRYEYEEWQNKMLLYRRRLAAAREMVAKDSWTDAPVIYSFLFCLFCKYNVVLVFCYSLVIVLIVVLLHQQLVHI